MSNHGWDGGCWIVLDLECEPISGHHHTSEAAAHRIALPLGYNVRREQCALHSPFLDHPQEPTP